ncbi:MAG: hypothetical protein KA436_02660 [Oligoflexales bacterium]|nr:hypothetical protein [Oligoflexales bacterium]
MVLFLTATVVGYCSIVYELILAQCLSVALGNTVVRYAMTIGLYLFSLGMGSLFLHFYPARQALRTLFLAETCLAGIGLVLPFALFGGTELLRSCVEELGLSPASFDYLSSVFIHLWVILIGCISGLEVPLLMELTEPRDLSKESLPSEELDLADVKPRKGDRASKILACDYIATFAGAVSFPFFIHQTLGLIAGSALMGILNAFAALLLSFQLARSKTQSYRFWNILLILIVILALCVIWKEEFFRSHLIDFLFPLKQSLKP